MKLCQLAIFVLLCSGCATTPPPPPSASPTPSPSPADPFEAWRMQNDQFMQEVSHTQGVVCTASGLCYEGLSQGAASPPDDNDLVVVSYNQTLIDGSPVQSFDKAAPARFPAGKVIWGFVEALKLMHAPAKARFYVPAKLAFEDRGAGTRVPPWSALIIDAELIKVDRVQ